MLVSADLARRRERLRTDGKQSVLVQRRNLHVLRGPMALPAGVPLHGTRRRIVVQLQPELLLRLHPLLLRRRRLALLMKKCRETLFGVHDT